MQVGLELLKSDMTAGMLADEKTKTGFLSRIPKGRIGRLDRLSGWCGISGFDEADYITGTTLYVDGGWLAK